MPLVLGVTLAHLWLIGEVLPDRLGDGAADTRPLRIDVAFVRELAPAPPPAVVAPAPRRPARAVPPPAAPAASAPAASVVADAGDAAAPLPDAGTPDSVPEPALPAAAGDAAASAVAGAPVAPAASADAAAPPTPAQAPGAVAAAASAAAARVAAVEASASAASAPAAQAFEWPPSTRLSYRLTGNYRGPVEGQAQVEWLRSGTRYQVHMDVGIGPAFAPLMSRRVSSEGEITPAGLRPSRYDEETRVVTRDPRRLVIFLDADRVVLPGGATLPRPPGVQDSASQFVQFTWLFTLQPSLLRTGVSIDLPLALPRRVETWTYDVLEEEILYTPAGAVPAFHVKPRREPKPGGDLTAEMWVAPSLQYLPVRILVRQDAETFVDLLIERLPLQAAPGR